jgi:hypothetical protein
MGPNQRQTDSEGEDIHLPCLVQSSVLLQWLDFNLLTQCFPLNEEMGLSCFGFSRINVVPNRHVSHSIDEVKLNGAWRFPWGSPTRLE